MKAMSATESLVYVAGLIWGKQDKSSEVTHHIGSVDEAHSFAAMLNRGG